MQSLTSTSKGDKGEEKKKKKGSMKLVEFQWIFSTSV